MSTDTFDTHKGDFRSWDHRQKRMTQEQAPKNLKILLAEDNSVNAKTASSFLRQHLKIIADILMILIGRYFQENKCCNGRIFVLALIFMGIEASDFSQLQP